MCKNKVVFSGGIKKEIRDNFDKNKIEYYDLMDFEEVALMNAIPTAEGGIELAMGMTETTLCGSNVLLTGFGRISKLLAKMLTGIGAKVYCVARSDKDLAAIDSFGYNKIKFDELDNYLSVFSVIFNTVPSLVLDSNRLDKIKKECVIIDLASNPGGVDFEHAKKIGIDSILALGLPAKVAPYSAAKYLKNAIDKVLEKRRG